MSDQTAAAQLGAVDRQKWLARVYEYFGVSGIREQWANAPTDQRRVVARTLGVPTESRVCGLAWCSTPSQVEEWINDQVAVPWDPCGHTTQSDVADLARTAT